MKLNSAAYKRIARNALKGHWLSAVGAGFCAVWMGAFAYSILSWFEYAVVLYIAAFFLESIPNFSTILLIVILVVSVFYFFFGGVIRLGYIDYNLSLLDRRQARLSNLGHHLGSWWDVIATRIFRFCIMSLLYLLLIVPGIMAHYSYAMVPYIIEEKPDFNMDEVFRASRHIMKKRRFQLFCLRFSFIGWYLLGFLTLGLGFLFVIPYKNAAEAAFYNEISGRADAYYGRRRGKHDIKEPMAPEHTREHSSRVENPKGFVS